MMMTSSLFGLDDMGALLWGPSSPTADPLEPLLLRPDHEQPEGGPASVSEGAASPASSLSSSSPSAPSSSSSSSPPPFYSPPPSPPPAALLQGDKAGAETDLLSLPWLPQPGQPHAGTGGCKEDMFCDLDWMTERVDLSEFDLDSLIGSCGGGPPDDEPPPGSPEDLLSSLDCPMELDPLPLPGLPDPAPPSPPAPPAAPHRVSPELPFLPAVAAVSLVDGRDAPSPPPRVPEPQEELEIKSEPASPAPSSSSPSPPAALSPPPSPAYALDLGSEVDVSDCEVKPVAVVPAVATVPQVPRIVLSLSPTRIVLLLAPKDEVGVATTTVTTTAAPTPSTSSSAPIRSPRSRPYPDPRSRPCPPASSPKVKSPRGAGGGGGGGGERGPSKAPRDKKIKKMEQNKTAATRYRQKKRAEHDALGTEYAALERRNVELTEKAESMAREIQYLKELMEEVRVARIGKGLGADL